MFQSSSIIQSRSIGNKDKLVVNLDIGDTYSGFSYATKKDFYDDQWTIQMNDAWNRDKDRTHKTCTTVLLEPNGKIDGARYGYEAETEYQEKFMDGEHEGYFLFRNIKKEFYKDGVNYDTKIKDQNGGKKKPLCDIMLAVLKFFKSIALKRIEQRFPDVPENEIFWVMAVPAAWKRETVMLYRDLVIDCGINYRHVCIVTEPEACLAYNMQYLKTQIKVAEERDKITNIISLFDARVLVLDLSGDATTISVHRVSGDKTFRMVFQSRSHRKGSSQVNDQFRLFLSNLIGEDIIRTLEKDYIDDYLTMCSEFEMRKRKITIDTLDTDDFSFKIPYQFEETFKETYDGEFVSIQQRISEQSTYRHRVSYVDNRLRVQIGVLKQLFDVVLDNISVYIGNVLQMEPCARIVSFMLVGGFSQSPLVQQGIKDRFPQMEVISPTDPELAITKGAIMMTMLPEVTPPVPSSGEYQRRVNDNSVNAIISQVCSVQ